MKTIAITLDEPTLKQLDDLAGTEGRGRNRSAVVRQAVQEYVRRRETMTTELREKEILRKNKARLQRQAAALVKEQATQ